MCKHVFVLDGVGGGVLCLGNWAVQLNIKEKIISQNMQLVRRKQPIKTQECVFVVTAG